MSTSALTKTFEFRGQALAFRETGDGWAVTAEEVARGLGYSNAKKVSNLFKRHEDEFKAGESCVLTLRTEGDQGRRVRVFTPRGVLRLALHAETEVAAEFRDFVLDVMEKLRSGGRVVTEDQVRELLERVTEAHRAEIAERDKFHAERARGLELLMGRLIDSHATDRKAVLKFAGASMRQEQLAREREARLRSELKIGQRRFEFPGDMTKAAN